MLDSAYMRIRMALIGGSQVAAEATAAGTAVKGAGTAAATSGKMAAISSAGWSKFQKGLGFVAVWAKRAGMALGVLAGVGIFKATNAAVDLNEEINKTKVVFKESSKDILRWSKDTNTRLGLSQHAALQYAGTFGNMLVPMGFARDEAASMSQQLVDLSADMASFNNTTPEEALEALRAGLAGETEPLRRYGIFLNDARVAQETLHDKTATSTQGMSEQEKALGRMGIILSDTKDAQGDFERTSGSLANQQRILSANLENLGAKIGAYLIPIVSKVVTWLNTLLGSAAKGKGVFATMETVIGDVSDALNVAYTAVKGFVEELLHGSGDVGKFGKDLRAIALAVKDFLVWAFIRARGALGQLWSGVKNIFGGMAKFIGGIVKIIGGILRGDWGRVWEGAKDVFSGAWQAIKGILQTMTSPFRAVFSAIGDIIKKLLDGPIGWIKGAIETIIDAIDTALDKINDLASKAGDVGEFLVPGGSHGIASDQGLLGIGGVPGLASGGTVQRRGLTLVGEQGPELLNLPKGASVAPLSSGKVQLPAGWNDGMGGDTDDGLAPPDFPEARRVTHVHKIYLKGKKIAEAVAEELEKEGLYA